MILSYNLAVKLRSICNRPVNNKAFTRHCFSSLFFDHSLTIAAIVGLFFYRCRLLAPNSTMKKSSTFFLFLVLSVVVAVVAEPLPSPNHSIALKMAPAFGKMDHSERVNVARLLLCIKKPAFHGDSQQYIRC